MVMVGKYRPCLQLPAKLFGHREQSPMQNPQPFRTAKVVCLLISGCRDKVSSAPGELMGGRMWPRCLRLGHAATMTRAWPDVKANFRGRVGKRQRAAAVQDAGAFTRVPRLREASWSAPDLWRFGIA